jgi:MoaA/NifB/PqqE/SkfB family radical SAM enzyme
MITPVQFTLFITNRCNARCEHCFYAGELFKGHELTLSQYEQFFTSLITPLESLLITGGEPFIREDLFDICCLATHKAKRRKIVIPTNGSRTERILSQISRLMTIPGIELEMQISLDGFEQTHDSIRKIPGLFNEAVKTAGTIQAAYPQIRLNFMTSLWEKNFKEALELAGWVKEHMGIGHKFQLVRVSGKGVYGVPRKWMEELSSKEENLGMPPLLELREFFERIKHILPPNDLFERMQVLKNEFALNILADKQPQLRCRAGTLDAVIYPDGQVAICEMTRSFASLLDYGLDFKALWQSPQAKEARLFPDRCFCIHSCNLLRSIPFDWKSLQILAELNPR